MRGTGKVYLQDPYLALQCGVETLRPQDTSAPVPKCLKTVRHRCLSVRDSSAPVPKCLETLRHRVIQPTRKTSSNVRPVIKK